MIRLLFLLIFIVVGLNAETFVDEFPIFVFGDVQSIENSFKFIQKFLEDDDAIEYIVELLAILFSMTTAWRVWQTQQLSIFSTRTFYIIAGVISLTGGFNVSMHIEDQRIQADYAKYGGVNYAKVDGIPWPIAMPTSLASTISLTFQQKAEDATVDIDTKNASYMSIGFAKAFGYATKIAESANFDKSEVTSKFGNAVATYLSDCVLRYGFESNTNIAQTIKNPGKDLFKAIDPVTLNISGNFYTVDYDNTNYTCEDLYNNVIISQYDTVATELIEKINDSTDINIDNTYTALGEVAGLKVEDSYIADNLGKYKAYVLNVATIPVIEQSIRNATSGTDISSGQDLANAVTLQTTKARLQSDGVGQFRWMAEILPFGFHFYLGIIYSISIIVLIVAIGMGPEKGLMVLSNYVQGLISFEFIRVALIFANNAVNQYSKAHAMDLIAEVGSNPATISSIPYHIDYMATMTGVAGLLGVSAVFLIPTMILAGKVGIAAGAIGGLGARYGGNDIEGASAGLAKQRAKQMSYEDAMRDRMALSAADKRALENMGISVGDIPSNMSAADYMSQLNAELDSSSRAWGAHGFNSDTLARAAHATKMSTAGSIVNGATIANNTSNMQHMNSGYASGVQQAGSVIANSDVIASGGVTVGDSLLKGSRNLTSQKLHSTMEVGDNMSYDAAKQSGTYMGANQVANANSAVRHMDNANDYRNDLQVLANAKTDSMIGKANATRKNFADNENAYVDSSDYGERSSILKTLAKIKAQGGVESAANYDERDATIKAAQQMGSVEGTERALKEMGKQIVEGMREYTGNQSEIQTRQGIGNSKALKDLISTDVGREKIEDFVNKSRAHAYNESDARGRDVDADLMRVGLIDKNGNINSENWVEATAALKATNMNSHNALIAGGMVFSGALGQNSTVQATALNSSQYGDTTQVYDDHKQVNRGDHLSFDGMINALGTGTFGEWGKNLLQGAGVLGAIDFMTGGGVRKSAKKVFSRGDSDFGGKPSPNSMNSSSDISDSHNAYKDNSGIKNSVSHDGPPARNFGGGYTSTHNESIASAADNVKSTALSNAGDVLHGAGKVLATGGMVFETAGVLGNIFTAMRDTGREYYSTGNLNTDRLKDAAISAPMTILNDGLDLINGGVSAVTAALITPFNEKSLSQNFNNTFDYIAKDYADITAKAGPDFFTQMSNGLNNVDHNYNALANNDGYAIEALSAGGTVAIGQDKFRNVRFNGMTTNVPFSEFQTSMQDENFREQFSQTLANSNMSNANSSMSMSADNMPRLMEEMHNKFNDQQFLQQRTYHSQNTVASYVDEVVRQNDDFHTRMDDLNKTLEKIENRNKDLL